MKKKLKKMKNASILLFLFVKIPLLLAENQQKEKVDNTAQISVSFKLKEEKNFNQLSEAKETTKNLRRQLLEMLEASNKQKDNFKILQLSIAANLKNFKLQSDKIENINSLKSYLDVNKRLIEKSYNFYDFIGKALQKKHLSSKEKEDILKRCQSLKKETASLYASEFKISKNEQSHSFFIVSIEKDLGIAIISIGKLDGVRIGDIAESADKMILIKVICLKNNVSSVIVTKGSLGDLVQGKKFFLKKNHKLNSNIAK